MPGGFPLPGDVCAGTDYGAVAATSLGTLLTASASTNTKGSWSQLGSALSFDVSLIHLTLYTTTAARNIILDIGIGASGSQQVLMSNLYFRPTGSTDSQLDIILPMDIPTGSVLWGRAQSNTASSAVTFVKINGYSGGFVQGAGHSGGDGIGITLGSSVGTTLTASAAGNTKGSYAQLIASTARDYSGLIVLAYGQSATEYLMDIAIGASGSEQVIMPNVMLGIASMAGFYIPLAVPSGTRVAARCQCAAAAADTIVMSAVGMYR